MEHLHLQPRPCESRSRAWSDDTPIEVRPPRRKQVRLDVDKELGNNPTFPPGLTLFLVEGAAVEWDHAPRSSTPMPLDSPKPAPSKSPKSCPTYGGGAWPKVPPNHLLVNPNWDPDPGQRKARPSKLPPQVDLGRDVQAWHLPPPLVEGDESQ